MSDRKLTQFKNCWILRDGKIIKEDFWIRGGLIVNPEEIFFVERLKADVTVDCNNDLIAPGYIDIQINGGWGVDFSFETENVEHGIATVCKHLIEHGVTSYCPTLVTSDSKTYHKILPRIKRQQGGYHGATVLGVHLEGPFINAQKKGAHALQYIKDPEHGIDSILSMYGHLNDTSIVTIAPELNGSLDAIKGLTKRGIRVAVGHSMANLAQGLEAVNSGANMITHLFNAMLPFHHRDPGLVGLLASNVSDCIHYGIISDGIHTHPAALRIAHRTNPEGLLLVTDAVPALGLPDGDHHIGPMNMRIKDGRAYIIETGDLCGSTTTMDQCVRKFKDATGCSQEYALEAASLHPARALGLQNKKGTLSYGSDADFIILTNDSLLIKSTWIAGECVYQNKSN